MDVAFLQALIGVLAPTSWFVAAAAGLLAPRGGRTRPAALHAIIFCASAFLTRLAIEHHESRSQITCFLVGAGVVELLRGRRNSGLTFWAVAAAASTLGVVAARPIAHRYAISTW